MKCAHFHCVRPPAQTSVRGEHGMCLICGIIISESRSASVATTLLSVPNRSPLDNPKVVERHHCQRVEISLGCHNLVVCAKLLVGNVVKGVFAQKGRAPPSPFFSARYWLKTPLMLSRQVKSSLERTRDNSKVSIVQ